MGNRQTSTFTIFAAAALGLLTFGPSSGCSSKSIVGRSRDGRRGRQQSAAAAAAWASGRWRRRRHHEHPGDDLHGRDELPVPAGGLPGGGDTTLSGTVYDPAGKIPLYGVVVYVPNTVPRAHLGRVVRDLLDLYTAPVVSAVTDASGKFTIKNMPVGQNIPLVVQVGKWRMQYTLSNVAQCVENDAASLAGREAAGCRRTTCEGDMPNIAISTGRGRLARVPAPPHGRRRGRVHAATRGQRAHPHLHGRRRAERPRRAQSRNPPASTQAYQCALEQRRASS